MTKISNLEAVSATTKTTTNNTARLIAEMCAVHVAQMQEMTALVAAATDINVPAPALREGKAQIHMNPDGTRRVRYPPPRGVKTTGVDRNIRAVHTCRNCTKNLVTHTDAECLELATKKGNRKTGWTSYLI